MDNKSLAVLGCGVSFQSAEVALSLDCEYADMQTTLLPARLRRRTSIATKMAFSAAERACANAGIEPCELPVVFTSSLGEAAVTDQLCRNIASQNFPLSPTKFHNSVHNTASGYWSIAVKSTHPAMAMGGYQDSFALALLETWSQLHTVEKKVLLVCYEETPSDLLLPENHWQACATAFVLSTDQQLDHALGYLTMPYGAERLEPVLDDKLFSPATASLLLYKALNKKLKTVIDISPAAEQAWFVEVCADA